MASISHSEFKQQIQELDPTRFEHFVADLWSAEGWNTRVTREQGDRGIDIVATRDSPVSEKHLIQVKRYGPDNPVGSPDVQQYASLRQQEQAVDAVVIVTSGRFSKQAERVARDLNVKLVDGDDLYEMVESHGLLSVVADYLDSSDTASQGTDQVRPPSDSTTETTEDTEPSKRLLGVMASVLLVAVVVVGGAIAFGGLGDKGAGTDSANLADATTETATPPPTPAPTQSITESRPFTVGESATRDGLRLTVSNYTFADRLGNTAPSFGTPAEGAKFLLVHVSVENIGNVQQEPPTRIRLYYYDEQIDRHGLFSENFMADGQRYRHYFADGTIWKLYPEDVSEGWVVYEVPQEFDPKHAIIQIGYDNDLRWKLQSTETSS